MVCSHKDKIMPDYAAIDDHTILSYIFYPRGNFSISPKWGFDVFVTVEEGAVVHCRFYKEDNTWPWILHFHGNGEVVSDYDEISLFYLKNGLNLVVADYRGYGKSTGEPSLANLVHDSHIIYRAVVQELSERGFNEALTVMGRSLGSIAAIEIAHQSHNLVSGLIIESGFSSIARLLTRLGVSDRATELMSVDKECVQMIEEVATPALIIHGEYDTLVPLEEAEFLNEHIGSKQKKLVIIPGGDHNDIMFVGLKQYFQEIRQFIDYTRAKKTFPL